MNENNSQKRSNHNIVIVMMTVSCLGCVGVSLSQGWEFWVPPLLVIGTVACWFMHISQYRQEDYRENFYLIFSMLMVLYHGVHESSFFDIFVSSALAMSICTMLQSRRFMHLFLLEFLVLMGVQVHLATANGTMEFDSLFISRVMLHVIVAVCVYRILLKIIDNLKNMEEELLRRDKGKEQESLEMEDFLVNLSHELRTPVNVINGMSTLILKKEKREDVNAILDGGRRLSRQIEDIQDYSEIRKGKVSLEEETYMITSLVNDVLLDIRDIHHREDLELVVDLSPEVPTSMKGDVKKFHKILYHLLDNAFKFNRRGGVLLCIRAVRREYGVNLVFEVTDTGVGMSKKDIDGVSKGLYQANKKRNRSTGGVGLGLSVVYGFIRSMGGFVKVDSKKGEGTTVRITVAQEVVDPTPCLSVAADRYVSVVYFMQPERDRVSAVGAFYRSMANHMAAGLRTNLYFAFSQEELKRQLTNYNITHVFMGQNEYENNRSYFDSLANTDVTVAVSINDVYISSMGSSKVIRIPKPIYAFPLVQVLNGVHDPEALTMTEERRRPVLDGLRVLVVDDEPMNLVVAVGLFKDYRMITDTAKSGREAIEKFRKKEYDLVFMDHMMPEMDGVEAMKRLRQIAEQDAGKIRFVALTANAVSGAREMFLREGFDGFIRKPIDINEFEHTMWDLFPHRQADAKGGNV